MGRQICSAVAKAITMPAPCLPFPRTAAAGFARPKNGKFAATIATGNSIFLIWVLKVVDAYDRETRLLTIEVRNSTRQIVQVRAEVQQGSESARTLDHRAVDLRRGTDDVEISGQVSEQIHADPEFSSDRV